MKFTRLSLIALLSICLLSGCAVFQPVTDLFADDEKIEIRELDPIEPTVTLAVQWDQQIGNGVDGFFSRLTPVANGDLLYAADRAGKVVALDVTGKRIWSRDISPGGWLSRGPSQKLAGGLVLHQDKLWVGTEDGRLLALDATTGDIVFDHSVVGEILAKPVFADGVVIVNTTAGRLFALDEQTGEEQWMHESDVPPLSLRGISQPAATNGGVLVGTPTGKLQVNVSDSGLVAWEATVATPTGATELERIIDVDSQPVIVGGLVYVVSYSGSLVAVELRSGRVVWQREYASFRNIAIENNTIFVTDVGGVVYAVDRRNGVELWSQNALRERALTSPIVFGEHLVVTDSYGVVHTLDKSEGAITGRLMLDNREGKGFFSSPVVFNDLVIVVDVNGRLSAIALNP